ncbi:B-cell linker protein isoform X2 [Ascaphus truei]|uniref:B-cell linker protein isoform X2 n=1 Tax=Ascaphus truei TaxID=8439 RepID=UPI003F5A7AF9
MALRLPFREDFENWTTSEVADLLKQCGMQECTVVLDTLGLNGHTFLNITECDLNKFNIMYQPQLQKMVQDIKKNEGGLMQKIKKFQNDQVALFCKTGKDTWDRITNKGPPSVPRRDYASGNPGDEEEQWSDDFDSDYENADEQSDSETYVVPSEDGGDDNYEPPPTEQENIIPKAFSFSASDGAYADKHGSRQLPSVPSRPLPKPKQPLPRPAQLLPKPTPLPTSSQTLPKATPNKPLPKPQFIPRSQAMSQAQSAINKQVGSLKQQCNDEDDYIVPEEEEEDDNYIEPTQDPPLRKILEPAPAVVRTNKPPPPTTSRLPSHQSAGEDDRAVYEVPENESKPSPPPNRNSLPLPRRNCPPKVEPTPDEYETCDNHIADNRLEPQIKFPSPLPRNGKPKTPIPPKPKPSLPPWESNSNSDKPTATERRRISSVGAELPLLPPIGQKLPVPIPKPNIISKAPEIAGRTVVPAARNHTARTPSTGEQEAGVFNKDWYASTCDRKTAEEALYASYKDGSFLVRKSSGQDSNQPYTLVVFYNRRVYNIPVRFIETTRQYALGREKSGEERFNSVAEMIDNHQRTSLVLIDSQNNTKDSTKLKHAVRVP